MSANISENAISEADFWQGLQEEARQVIAQEPSLSGLLATVVLSQRDLPSALAVHLAQKLGNDEVPADILAPELQAAYDANAAIGYTMESDVMAAVERDPACQSKLDVVLYYKGFLALQAYRATSVLIAQGRRSLALYLQNRTSEIFQADIHPNAMIGRGVFIDHATGVVIGETARVGNNVTMLQGVTLGGNGKDRGDRHPKIADGVLISVGAKVLGNIQVGECAKIGGGSVVLTDIPAYSTAVGVPAKVIGKVSTPEPSRVMDHRIDNS